MSNIELLALVASIASLILAIGAIWLSIVFFNMSNKASQATTKASEGIDASIQRLENLFDKLYSDTFSMMKDTVTDMRKHIWNGDENSGDGDLDETNKNTILEEADRKAEEKLQDIKSDFEKQLSEILHEQKVADGKVSDMSDDLKELLENVIQTSSVVESEAREETVRSHITKELRMLLRRRKTVTAGEVVKKLRNFIPTKKIVTELEEMKSEGLLFSDSEEIMPDTNIRFLSRSEKLLSEKNI